MLCFLNDYCYQKWTQKCFQELVFKAVKNCKHSGFIDRQEIRLSDQNLLIFLQSRATCSYVETMSKIVNEVNNNVTKVLGEFFGRLHFFVFLPNSRSNLQSYCGCIQVYKGTITSQYSPQEILLKPQAQ